MKYFLKKRLGPVCERVVYESRWLLYVFSIGLVVAMAVYMGRFAVDTFHFVIEAQKADMEDVMVLLLGLVDHAMVATLVVMIAKGSYQIFIHKFEAEPDPKPGWLDHIDTGLLKVKTAQSIASITGVALLKDFVNIEHLDWVLVVHKMIVHGVCLLSALVFAFIWRVTHTDEKHEEHPTHAEVHNVINKLEHHKENAVA